MKDLKCGVEIVHYSTSSSVLIKRVYKEEVAAGEFEKKVQEDWYDYSQIEELYSALKHTAEGGLKWLLENKN